MFSFCVSTIHPHGNHQRRGRLQKITKISMLETRKHRRDRSLPCALPCIVLLHVDVDFGGAFVFDVQTRFCAGTAMVGRRIPQEAPSSATPRKVLLLSAGWVRIQRMILTS